MSETDATAVAASARVELERLLAPDDLGIRATLPAAFGDAVEHYVRLLLDANERQNLTRIVEPADVARLHLLDSLAALPILDALAPGRVMDLGSGGGVPGIVLALARPRVAWTLVDAVRKKAAMLLAFSEALRLPNVTVVAERAETLGRDPDHRARYDVVTARACAALPVLAEYALPLLATGGTLLAWKGAMDDEELAGGRVAAEELGGGSVEVRPDRTAVLGDHRFVLVPKVGPTPDRYPRRPGEPARRPLGSSRG